MPGSAERSEADGPKPKPGDRTTGEPALRAEEVLEDAEEANEAMDEALKQGAVPWERAKKETDDGPDGLRRSSP